MCITLWVFPFSYIPRATIFYFPINIAQGNSVKSHMSEPTGGRAVLFYAFSYASVSPHIPPFLPFPFTGQQETLYPQQSDQ